MNVSRLQRRVLRVAGILLSGNRPKLVRKVKKQVADLDSESTNESTDKETVKPTKEKATVKIDTKEVENRKD